MLNCQSSVCPAFADFYLCDYGNDLLKVNFSAELKERFQEVINKKMNPASTVTNLRGCIMVVSAWTQWKLDSGGALSGFLETKSRDIIRKFMTIYNEFENWSHMYRSEQSFPCLFKLCPTFS
jgi:hypothetical protein